MSPERDRVVGLRPARERGGAAGVRPARERGGAAGLRPARERGRPGRRLFPALAVAAAASLWASSGGFAQAAIWTPEDVRFSESAALSLTTLSGPCAALLPDGSIYGVWYERTGPRSAVVRGAARSPDGTWLERDYRISLGDSLSRNPTVAVSPGGDVHVVWEDLRHVGGEEIYYRHRTPAGVWEAEERLTDSDLSSIAATAVAGPDGRLHVVWSDGSPGNFEILHRYRDPAGGWSPVHRLTTTPGKSLTPVAVAAPDGTLHLAWQDNIINPQPGDDSNNTEIYYMRIDAEGAPLTAPERVSHGLGASRNPALALGADGVLYIFWSDNRDPAPNSNTYFPYAIWFRRRLPDLGFGHEKRFAYSGSDHLYPSVAISPDGTVNAVWEDFPGGNSELYFRQIRILTGWEPAIRVTQTVGPTRNPTILADGNGNLHLVWSDTYPGEEASIRYRLGHVTGSTARALPLR